MGRMHELILRGTSAFLVLALSSLQRRLSGQGVYRISKDGAAAEFESSWFVYHPREFGATGNIDFMPEAENATRKAIFSRLKGDETFYDIGAHGGVYTITLQKAFPGLEIHSFEPQPEDLLKNLALNSMSSLHVHKVAIGETVGQVTMTTKNRSSNHVSAQGNRVVPMVRLDDFFAEKNLSPPNWIKIDIEGLELPALRGAEQLLRSSQPTVICEINHLFDRYGSTIPDFIDYMVALGLYPHRLRDNELNLITGARSLNDLGYSEDNNFWFMPR